ncbi:MAG: two-component system chemotaxis response regulator CheY [Candidatus Omnitrophota bacterium]|jgi:two-component system chemotaxis response regulator CheY
MFKVLVVEDEEFGRELILELLTGLAMCDMATNGHEGFVRYMRSLEKDPYDIILLDISMPKMDGIKLLKLIAEYQRALSIKEQVPIIVVTAMNDRVEEAMALGCSDYMLKPLHGAKLIEMMKKYMHK